MPLRYPAIAAVPLVLVLRLALAHFGPTNFDQGSFRIVVGITQNGGNVYAETVRYNYSPLWAYTLLALSGLANLFQVDLATVVRGFLTLVDGLNALLIARISSPRNGLLYWLNPVSILLVSVHGQFETLALMPILLALLVPRRTWLLGTISLLVKHLTLPLVWMLFAYRQPPRRAALYVLGSGLVFAASVLPFVDGWRGILSNVLLYNSALEPYGLYLFSAVAYGLLGLAVLFAPAYARNWPLAKGLTFAAVTFLVLTPRVGEQYFLLPVLLGSLMPSRSLALYSAVTTLFLLSSPSNLHWLDAPPLWYGVWLATCIWFGVLTVYPTITAKLRAGTPDSALGEWRGTVGRNMANGSW